MLIIIQARSSSKRLPGKVLKKINGKPLLGYMLESIQKIKNKPNIVIATSKSKSDETIYNYCKKNNINCFRGDLHKVSRRFLELSKMYKEEYFIRLCGDSPLISRTIINKLINISKKDKFDLITNRYCNYPKGQTVEIIRSKKFNEIHSKFFTKEHFEHVTQYYYENPKKFKIKYFHSNKDIHNLNFAVDNFEDFRKVDSLIKSMKKNHTEYRWDELISLYKKSKIKNL